MPADLLGIWVTDAQAYAGRSLEIKIDRLVFGTGAYSSDVYLVHEVEPLESETPELARALKADGIDPDAGWTAYRIAIRESDAELARLEIAVRSGATPELRFRHRSETWRPQGSVVSPTAGESAARTRRNEFSMATEGHDG